MAARETKAERDAREVEEGFENIPDNLPATTGGVKPVTLKSAAGEETVQVADLRELNYAQLEALFGQDAFVVASDAIGTDQYGPILEDKGQLVGKPFVIVHWNFYAGDFGPFASLWVLTPANEKFIVNDGSTGIYAQLRDLSDKKDVDSMLVCKHGLRVSEYDFELPNGTVTRAKTYYIDTKL